MFGYKTVRSATLTALETKITALEGQVKGFYENTDQNNQYFRSIASLLKGFSIPDTFQAVNRLSLKEAYEGNGPAFGIISKIAKAVGEMFPYLELRDRRTGDYIENHWLLDLIFHPNDRYNVKRFGRAWATNYLVYGDAWVYSPVMTGKRRGEGSEMYVIPSYRIAVEKGGYRTPVKGIRVQGGGATELIEPKNYFQSFIYNLDDTDFFGTSPLVVAAIYLSIIDRGMKRQDQALKNGGPSALVTPKPDNLGVLPVSADNLTEELNGEEVKGQIKALRTAIELHELGSSPVDPGILSSHKEAVNALCFIYDIPVDLYYGQAKYENAKEAKKSLYENNAIPLANEFAEDILSHFGLTDQFTLRVNTDMVDVLKEDASDVLDNLAKMGATLNEKREAYGYEPRPEPWADLPMVGMGTMFGNETFDIDENAPTE